MGYVPKALEHYVDQLANGIQEPQWPDNVNPVKDASADHFASQVGGVARAVTPTASVSTGLSDSEDDDVDDHDDDDNSDVDVNYPIRWIQPFFFGFSLKKKKTCRFCCVNRT